MIWRWFRRKLIKDIEERMQHLEQAYEQIGREIGRIENDLIKIIIRVERLEKAKKNVKTRVS